MDFQEEPEEVEEGAPAWMATFADMATLLMTFFVLLLSFANMDIVEFRTLMGSVRDAFGVQFEQPGDYEARANSPIWISEGGSPTTPSILESGPLERVRRALEERGLAPVVDAEMTRRGVALRIRDGVLFESGSDELKPRGLEVLTELGELSTEFVEEIAVEGHTDDRPISTARFPSNWELSAARATAVLRYLERSHPDELSMSIAGYADTRPVADNDSAEGRSRNRRVELILIRPPEPDEADDRDEVGDTDERVAVAETAPAAEDEDIVEEPTTDADDSSTDPLVEEGPLSP